MSLSAELPLSTGEKMKINENEINAIKKWLDFKAAQEAASNEVKTYREADEEPREEDHFKVSVDPFDDEHWESMLKGFLAAHGIIGWRNMAISTFVYYNEIELNFPKQ